MTTTTTTTTRRTKTATTAAAAGRGRSISFLKKVPIIQGRCFYFLPVVSLLLLSLLLHVHVQVVYGFNDELCSNDFEKYVLCHAINDTIEPHGRSMKLQNKDLTYCPHKCQICKPIDYLEDDDDQIDQQTLKTFYEHVHCGLDYNTIPNIWNTNSNNSNDSMNQMYERIITDPNLISRYRPTILSHPKSYVPDKNVDVDGVKEVNIDESGNVGIGPWLLQLEDFFTEEECDEMIRQTKIAINTDPNGDEPKLQNAWMKIEHLVDLPFQTHTEPVHFIQYVPGQKYGSHTDSIPEEFYSMTGPRLFTILFYLNDINEDNGGETCFSQIIKKKNIIDNNNNSNDDNNSNETNDDIICVQPKKGRALIWPNVRMNNNDDDDEITTTILSPDNDDDSSTSTKNKNNKVDNRIEIPENRTWHEANPIKEGYKYAGTVWYHLRNFTYAEQMDCTDIYTDTTNDDGSSSRPYYLDGYDGYNDYHPITGEWLWKYDNVNDQYEEDDEYLLTDDEDDKDYNDHRSPLADDDDYNDSDQEQG
ncbi:hypothetical protein FRACYDRAFT_233520 [Fragilariopsis cylindrus CCMP1102]|uniref:Fe2OG dioxygenase domain-containing protein n=1 Tax=Fragilariopsis cylindrus CCMP1102 TaxID=635003 RepID=A0A1E7FYY2_9STRA|nr:hypothetical protein FRACYDRAFT_233520 [Fragilariopsis cylindrus CCMP1102]|eukprot:OEU23348.1 hypothetical protein FRACYDRAFT_233520 [Fragilariopsis cylindrus CCMP1102]